MKVGSLSAAWSAQPLGEVLSFFAEAGLEAIEIGTGAYPGDAHCDPFELKGNKRKRDNFVAMIKDHGLVISALSCHGNPLHPNKKLAQEHHEVWRATADLACATMAGRRGGQGLQAVVTPCVSCVCPLI